MAAWAQVRAAVAATLLMAGGPVPAQEAASPAPDLGTTISPVLTLDQERLFAQSLWGKRVLAAIEAAQAKTIKPSKSFFMVCSFGCLFEIVNVKT